METTLISHMGSDLTVVNAARVSFAKESDWDFIDQGGTLLPEGVNRKVLSTQDQKLIKYLAKHNHWTPFSHVQITMREKVPIFVARQRFKHTVGFSYNEVSRRYVDDLPEFFVPDVWRKRSENKKQGSSDEEVKVLVYKDIYQTNNNTTFNKTTPVKEEYKYFIVEAERLYNKMIECDVAPEQARMILPQSMYTEYYVTGSLAAWARAYKLRSDLHSQKEIQELAKEWNRLIGGISELETSWKALTK